VSVASWGVGVSYDFDSDISSFDVVMMLRVQRERMVESFFPSEREYARSYGLNAARVEKLKAGAIVMHPGPMNRGLEISADAADSARSVIPDQVRNGVSIRMAVLYLLLSGESV
jgi:aspartate carbamoyltransferase catalytic subunit